MILWPFFAVFLLTFHYRPTQQTSWYPKIKVLLLDISFQVLHLPLKVVRYPKISWSESEDSILHYCEEDIEIQILQSMELLSIVKRNFCAYGLFSGTCYKEKFDNNSKMHFWLNIQSLCSSLPVAHQVVPGQYEQNDIRYLQRN